MDRRGKRIMDIASIPITEELLTQRMRFLNWPPRGTDRNRERARWVGYFDKYRETVRRQAFDEMLPHLDELRFMHPDPITYREIARALRRVRHVGYRQEVLRALAMGLDLSVDSNWHWFWAHRNHISTIWPLSDDPIEIPASVTRVTISPAAHREWHPDTTLWDLNDAAMHELELEAGGTVFLELHDEFEDDDPRKQLTTKVRTRVKNYLNLHYSRRENPGLPEDPYDPIHWGHDSALSGITITVTATSENVPITPDFDPDVHEYAVGRSSLEGLTIIGTPRDLVTAYGTGATVTPAAGAIGGAAVILVTAKDDTHRTTYTIRTTN